ncbi:MAG: hypothetical protein BWX91_01746 [Spirochaetes bacterium ADurb.Bin133]|jgi:hypothetical protein|nr:MAG: hypothetical protein BWX91_01746 [Spirochaetes bacterium ADurb.Bin133]
MRKIIFFTILFLFISLFYTVFFPVKSHKLEDFKINSIIDVTSAPIQDANIDGYYQSSNECGYFSIKSGMIHRFLSPEEDIFVQANSYGYITYSKYGNFISLFSNTGKKLKDVGTLAYPYISSELPMFYAIKTNGSGFSMWTMNGDKLFGEINYSSIVTSISTDKLGNTLASNLDGKTYLYSPKGKTVYTLNSSGSKVNFAKSNAFDVENDYFAITSGLYPETIEIFSKKTGIPVLKFETSSNFTYKTLLEFNNKRLYYETESALAYFDIKNKKNGKFDFKGELREVKFDPKGNILISSSDSNTSRYYLSVYSPTNILYYYKEFDTQTDNFNFIGENSFYFRIKNYIVKISKNA